MIPKIDRQQSFSKQYDKNCLNSVLFLQTEFMVYAYMPELEACFPYLVVPITVNHFIHVLHCETINPILFGKTCRLHRYIWHKG